MNDSPLIRLVLTTCSSAGHAGKLARALVEERLVACATILPAVESIYHWEGQIETSAETLVLLKTTPDQIPALEARLHELHTYQTPEFVVVAPEAVSQPYLDWLTRSLERP